VVLDMLLELPLTPHPPPPPPPLLQAQEEMGGDGVGKP